MTLSCIFEKGVLRPQQPIALPEGAEVEVIIVAKSGPARKTPGEIMTEIAALPVEGGGDPFTSRDHDRYLYGEQGMP